MKDKEEIGKGKVDSTGGVLGPDHIDIKYRKELIIRPLELRESFAILAIAWMCDAGRFLSQWGGI